MKKFIVLCGLCLSLALFQVSAAQGIQFGVGGVLGIPTGDWSNATSSVGFGGIVQGLFQAGPNLSVGGQAGYMTFGGEEFGGLDYGYSAIPVLGEARFWFGLPAGPRPFVGALVGVHIFSVSVKGEVGGFSLDQSDSESKFTFAPQAGIKLGTIELVGFYMIISDANYFGGRVGFSFGQ